MKKKGILIGILVGVVMVVIIVLNFNKAAIESTPNGLFIGLGLMSDRLAMAEQVILREKNAGGTVLTGVEMDELLKSHYTNWKVQDNEKTFAALPDYTVYYNFGTGDRIEFYKGSNNFVQVINKDEKTVYAVDQATLENLAERLMTSDYYLPSEVFGVLVESKRIERQSVDDVPQNLDFRVLKVGQTNYYLYESEGKYFIESPKVYIAEVTENSYKSALNFVEPIPSTEMQTEPTSQELTTESYDGQLGSDFEKIGVLKSGTEVYFKKAGFYNKLEKGEQIVLKSGELAYSVIEGMPGRPEISPNGELMAFIDVIEFEALGNLFVYRDKESSIEQMTDYAYGPEVATTNSDTVKDCLWLNNEELLVVIGFSVGTITQGGDVYLLNALTKEKELVFKANKNEEVANITMTDGQFVFEIVYWTDENMMNHAYREEQYSQQQILDMKK